MFQSKKNNKKRWLRVASTVGKRRGKNIVCTVIQENTCRMDKIAIIYKGDLNLFSRALQRASSGSWWGESCPISSPSDANRIDI